MVLVVVVGVGLNEKWRRVDLVILWVLYWAEDRMNSDFEIGS